MDAKANVAKKPTLAEALQKSGFIPYSGSRVIVEQGRKREPLKLAA
ncbi:hypothetical protein EV561_1078 [Rhizobium sp. BK376]|nr:hypothetical protein EV561_1078 [Rhizobium sp. BK376]